MVQKDSSFPYRDLYIYMIEGAVHDGGGESFGDAYIGTWVEGDSSFMFFERPSMEVVGNLLRDRPELRLLDDFYFTYEQRD